MNYWITSDLHLGHENIIRFCNRPYRTVEEMNDTLVKNFNERVRPEDTVFLLGDLCFKGQCKWNDWKELLNGEKIIILGNHDVNNDVRSLILKSVIDFGGSRVGLVHNPDDFVFGCDFTLCGHVHEQWKTKWEGRHLIVNVGVDQWNYRPQNLQDIVQYAKGIVEVANASK